MVQEGKLFLYESRVILHKFQVIWSYELEVMAYLPKLVSFCMIMFQEIFEDEIRFKWESVLQESYRGLVELTTGTNFTQFGASMLKLCLFKVGFQNLTGINWLSIRSIKARKQLRDLIHVILWLCTLEYGQILMIESSWVKSRD